MMDTRAHSPGPDGCPSQPRERDHKQSNAGQPRVERNLQKIIMSVIEINKGQKTERLVNAENRIEAP